MLSIWLRIATAMSEIVVGTVAQLALGAFIGGAVPGVDQTGIKFLAGTGAIVLTFLAGAGLDPTARRTQCKQTTAIGMVAFLAPFLGCTAVIGSAVVPTLIANAFFLPHHLVTRADAPAGEPEVARAEGTEAVPVSGAKP